MVAVFANVILSDTRAPNHSLMVSISVVPTSFTGSKPRILNPQQCPTTRCSQYIEPEQLLPPYGLQCIIMPHNIFQNHPNPTLITAISDPA